jgi:hypothetical protein
MTVSLTEEERAKARYFLGYSGISSNFDPRSYFPSIPAGLRDGTQTFENSIRSIIDNDTYAIIQSLLAQIESLRVSIGESATTLIADRIEGAVTLNKQRQNELWREDYRLCCLLANMLMVTVQWHPSMVSGYGTMGVRGG